MRFVERGTQRYYIEDIHKEDFKFSNIAAKRLPGSADETPRHVYVLWINNPELLAFLKEQKCNVRDLTDINGNVKYYCEFKAYVGMDQNKITGKEELRPKVVLKTADGDAKRLKFEELNRADAYYITEVNIVFHIYHSTYRGDHYIPAIDEIWAVEDPNAAQHNVRDNHFADKFGYKDDEEMPFK